MGLSEPLNGSIKVTVFENKIDIFCCLCKTVLCIRLMFTMCVSFNIVYPFVTDARVLLLLELYCSRCEALIFLFFYVLDVYAKLSGVSH